MAAPIHFETDAEEYAFVLKNPLLFDAVFKEFGYKPVSIYGSYAQVNPQMRTQILGWVHRQDIYWDVVFGSNEEESIDKEEDDHVMGRHEVVEKQQNVVGQPQVVVEEEQGNVVLRQKNVVDGQIGNQIGLIDGLNLEERISDLEIIFRQLKEMKEKRQRDESTEESSGSNQLG